MSLTITIPGAVDVTTGSTAPATLTIGVGVPGAQGPQGATGPGVPAGGTAGQYLQKIDGTNYNTDWVTLNLSSYLTTASAAATYQTLAGMSSYLTTSAAASTYYPLSGNPSGFLTSSALTGYATQSWVSAGFAPLARAVPSAGTTGQVLTKNSGTDYDASWATFVPGDRYLTTSSTSNSIGNGTKTFTVGTGLSYTTQQDIVIAYDASNHMHALVTSYNSGTGVLVADVQHHSGSGTYTSWTVNVGGTTPLQTVEWGEILGTLGDQSDLSTALNAKLSSATAATTYAALAGATFTGEVITPASTTSNAGLTITPGTAPSTPTNGEIWATTSDLQIRLNGVTETLAEQSWVTSQGYITSSALTPYAPLAGSTFTGLVTTAASTTTTAGLNVPHGAAPTTPVNGDVWTTTGGIFWRQNGSTKQAMNLGDTQTVSGNVTFSNANGTFGSSTAAGTINVGTGATISGSTKAVNIGTAGASGSTTNIAIGSSVSGSGVNVTVNGVLTTTGATQTIGNSTAASTLNLGTGATISGSTKQVFIGTSGVSGSTTNIQIGSTTGTSTTTLQGSTVGVTVAADTSSTLLATTAYVLNQAGSATPLVDGTAAVGSSLRYARQDHVHPTDTSRAALASPTFTGVPAAPTATVDTNTTQLATTAYVVGQAGSATPLVNGTAAVGTSLRYARQDHVHPTDTTRAALASPTFTGVPAAPTASAGTNTTQLATTAFVQQEVPAASTTAAGKVELATVAEGIVGTSNSLVPSLSLIPSLLARGELRSLGFIDYVQVSGAGQVSVPNVGVGYREMFLNSLATGRSSFSYGIVGTAGAQVSMSRADMDKIDFSKRIFIAGKTMTGGTLFGTNYIGDSNTFCRVTLGGYTAATTGDMTAMGIGWKKQGGTSPFVTLTVHNGTTLTDVASTVTQSDKRVIDWVIYSDGTGNVTLYINGVQAATTSAGPTGITATAAATYREQIEAATTPTVRQIMHGVGGWIYIEG